jgi:hypothetical protein
MNCRKKKSPISWFKPSDGPQEQIWSGTAAQLKRWQRGPCGKWINLVVPIMFNPYNLDTLW